MYIGGSFTRVDSSAQTGLAALDAATGVRDAGFSADVAGTVYALATDGTNVYVAGSFTSVAGVPRTNLAAVTLDGTGGQQLSPERVVDGGVTRLRQRDALHRRRLHCGERSQAQEPRGPVTPPPVRWFRPSTRRQRPGALDQGQRQPDLRRREVHDDRRRRTQLRRAPRCVRRSAALQRRVGLRLPGFDIATTDTAVYLGTGGHLPAGNSVYATAVGTGAQRWQVKTDGNVQTVEAQGGDVYAGGHFNNACLPPRTR